MADTKVSALTALATALVADYMPIVEATGPTTKKITVDNLLGARYAGISVTGAGVAQAHTAADLQLDCFTAAMDATSASMTAGFGAGAGDDKITIAEKGVYIVAFSLSFVGTASTNFHFALYQDTTAHPDVQADIATDASADEACVSAFGIVLVDSVPSVLDLRANGGAPAKSLTVHHGQFVAFRVGLTV